jgi:hypothetical protein
METFGVLFDMEQTVAGMWRQYWEMKAQHDRAQAQSLEVRVETFLK